MSQQECCSKRSHMYYSNTLEKMRNNHEQLKIERQMQFLKKQFLLLVRFRIQGKIMLEIYFICANKNNRKVWVPYYDMWKLPKITLKPLKNTCEEDHFQQRLLKDFILPKLLLKNLPKYIPERLMSSTIFCDNCMNFTIIFFCNTFS